MLQVMDLMKQIGLIEVSMVFGIDYTASNMKKVPHTSAAVTCSYIIVCSRILLFFRVPDPFQGNRCMRCCLGD